MDREEKIIIKDLINQLPERQRFVLLRRYGFLDGMKWKYQEIADETGCTRQAVYKLIHKAEKNLKKLLENYMEE